MKSLKLCAITISLALGTGCASGLNTVQQAEYNTMVARDLLVEEKDPELGALLGLLPGGGSFYAREPAIGVLNLLLWPASIFWDPISGYQGSKSINYSTTHYSVKKQLTAELDVLDEKLTLGQMNPAEYLAAKRALMNQYSY